MSRRRTGSRRHAAGLSTAILLLVLASPASAREPLKVERAPELFQRILTLPGARLSPAPAEPPAGAALPVFSVLYVYDRQPANHGWLQVGSKPDGKPEGWLPSDMTQDWQTMLVMQYAPRGQRDRVVMFDDRPPLADLLQANNEHQRAVAMLRDIGAGRPVSGVLAVEPAEAVDVKSQFYVMPVLGSSLDEFPDGTSTRVLQIASANIAAPPASTASRPVPSTSPAPTFPDFRIGIVFVLHTTLSMQPYIERARETIRTIYQRLEANHVADRVSFGLVGYRNDPNSAPGIEYSTHVFQALDPKATPASVLGHIDEIKAASFPTTRWDDDAFAGLNVALDKMDWTPFAARLLVLVTDSGAQSAKSKLSQFPDVDIENILERANEKHVAAFPIYLLTPQGDNHGNRSIALQQWRRLGRAGDPTLSKYISVAAGSAELYQGALDGFSEMIVSAIAGLAHNHPIVRPTQTPSGQTDCDGGAIRNMVVNELFRAQTEYLGHAENAQAPAFFRAWTTDHDLVNPSYQSLNVRVFLTSNQLNSLAQSLQTIVDEAKRASLSPESMFDNLQRLAALTSGDPNRPISTGDVAALLPAYLKMLPYRSKVLRIDKETWLSKGMTGQQEFIDELEYKLRQYQDMYQDAARWTLLDQRDVGNKVFPVPLESLP